MRSNYLKDKKSIARAYSQKAPTYNSGKEWYKKDGKSINAFLGILPKRAKILSIGYGIVSFRLPNISSIELGFLLAEENIIVRSGDLCNSDKEYTRIGLHIYNTPSDIDALTNSIIKLKLI